MSYALLNEVLESNQRNAEENKILKEQNESLKEQNESLKEYIARHEAENQTLKEQNNILLAKNRQLGLEIESLYIKIHNAAIENKRLRSTIRRNASMQKPENSLIKELQETNAFLENEVKETSTKTMEAMRLMARKLMLATKENAVLQANQELHMGIISDYKLEMLATQKENNQTVLRTSLQKTFVMTFQPPINRPDYLNTTRC